MVHSHPFFYFLFLDNGTGDMLLYHQLLYCFKAQRFKASY